MLQPGQPAPEFSLPDADMEAFDLASLRGKRHVVLFFYPKDGTPYCTQAAIDFSDHEADFAKLHCEVIGNLMMIRPSAFKRKVQTELLMING